MKPAVLELLASRICHDIISPVGAIHNGIEFLEETGAGGDSEAIGLIAHSARLAAAKLQAFRLAYGAGGRDPNIKPADVHKTFGELVDPDGKVKQDWNPLDIDAAAKPVGFCKILMGAMMLALEALPKGGTVRVANDGGAAITVTAEGPDAGPRTQVREALSGDIAPEDLDPRLVHPYVLGVLTGQYGFKLRIDAPAAGKAVFHLSVA